MLFQFSIETTPRKLPRSARPHQYPSQGQRAADFRSFIREDARSSQNGLARMFHKFA